MCVHVNLSNTSYVFYTFFLKWFSLQQRTVTHPPVVIPMDVSDLSTLPEKIAQIEETFGQIDILINNAGISVRADVVSMAVDLDVQVMLVNYFGAVGVTKGLFFNYYN